MADLVEITLDRAPPFLLGPWGKALLVVLGSAKQAFADATRHAVKARFPQVAPSDALPALAASRQIFAGRNESQASLRARILLAFLTWQYCGTKKGLIDALDAMFPEYPPSTEIEEYWEGGMGVDDTQWATFRLEMTIPHWGAAPLWDAFNWDDGSHWDITAPEADIRAVRATIHRWTPAYAKCVRLRVHVAGGVVVDIPDP